MAQCLRVRVLTRAVPNVSPTSRLAAPSCHASPTGTLQRPPISLRQAQISRRWSTIPADHNTYTQRLKCTQGNPESGPASAENETVDDATFGVDDGELNDCVDGNSIGSQGKPKQKVLVLWDLDNKPPIGSATETAHALRRLAESFGEVTEMVAYANKYAFIRIFVKKEARSHKSLGDLSESDFWSNNYPGGDDFIGDGGLEMPSTAFEPEPLRCSVCGQKSKNEHALRKHFSQLHAREQKQKLRHLASAKSGTKKKEKLWMKLRPSLEKYALGAHHINNPGIKEEAAIDGLDGLHGELERAGVAVKTVTDAPEAADHAIYRHINQAIRTRSRKALDQNTVVIQWVILVSDDKGFSMQLRKARKCGLKTHVIGTKRNKDLAPGKTMFTEFKKLTGF